MILRRKRCQIGRSCTGDLASAALTQNREVATTGDPVFDGFPSLLIEKMETEEDRLLVHM